MKKLIYLLLSGIFLLTACSSSKIDGEIEYKNFSLIDPFQSIYTDDGAYIFNRNNVFFYRDGQEQLLFTTYIVDDKFVQSEKADGESEKFSEDFKNYLSMKAIDNVYIMNERLYYISNYLNSKGENKYYLSSVNLLGKNRIDHFSFNEEPNSFYISDDYFIVGFFENEEEKYMAYDKNFNEHNLGLNGKAIIATYKSLIFHQKYTKDNDYELWVYDLKTMEDSLFAQNTGQITAIGDEYIATNAVINSKDMNDTEDNNSVTKVYRIEDRKEIYSLDNKVVEGFDNGKAYVRDTNKLNAYYEYDNNGELISEVDGSGYSDIFHIIATKEGKAIINSNRASNKYYYIDFKNQKIEPIEVE